MERTKAINPGPKPKKEDGSDDRRHRVTPETKPKHPDLKPHIHKPGEKKMKDTNKKESNLLSFLFVK